MSIRITSAINGFRRAGVAHPSKPTVYSDDHFTEQQLEQLRAEPRLVVQVVSEADPDADPQGPLDPDSASDGLTDAHLEGVVEPDGTQKDLAELTVNELRDLANDLQIDGYAKLKKAELVEAIKATPVQIDPEAEA